MPIKLTITSEDPGAIDALHLMDRLSESLAIITGDSGRSSFDPDDVRMPRALFVVARDAAGVALGCGAFRPLDEHTAEIKRMYAHGPARGVGSAILAHLEARALQLEYTAVWLETRLVNQLAVNFYERRGYRRIANYGKYAGNPNAVCFEKKLAYS